MTYAELVTRIKAGFADAFSVSVSQSSWRHATDNFRSDPKERESFSASVHPPRNAPCSTFSADTPELLLEEICQAYRGIMVDKLVPPSE